MLRTLYRVSVQWATVLLGSELEAPFFLGWFSGYKVRREGNLSSSSQTLGRQENDDFSLTSSTKSRRLENIF